MNTQIESTDPFVDQIMRSIVNQFFENPQIIVTDGSPYVQSRSTPSQVVAGRLLVEKQGELIDKIMERIDLDDFAEKVAQKVITVLTAPEARYGGFNDPDQNRRAEIKKKVDGRLVELMAQRMFNKMQPAECTCDAIEFGEMSKHLVPCPLSTKEETKNE